MFEIDEELYAVFEQVGREKFINSRVAKFKKEYPKRFDCFGKENVKKFVEYAFSKAEKYNMLAEREVDDLIILMHFLGCDFDIDPQYPWARFKRFPDKTYKEEEEPESYVHLQKVYDALLQFYQQIEGEDFACKKAACQRFAKTRFEGFYPFTNDSILQTLQSIYPERYACIPENALHGPVMQAAQSKSFDLDLDNRTGKVVMAVLLFMFGISVDTDPLHANLMHKLQTIDRGNVSGHYKELLFFNHLKSLVAAELRDMEDQEE